MKYLQRILFFRRNRIEQEGMNHIRSAEIRRAMHLTMDVFLTTLLVFLSFRYCIVPEVAKACIIVDLKIVVVNFTINCSTFIAIVYL